MLELEKHDVEMI